MVWVRRPSREASSAVSSDDISSQVHMANPSQCSSAGRWASEGGWGWGGVGVGRDGFVGTGGWRCPCVHAPGPGPVSTRPDGSTDRPGNPLPPDSESTAPRSWAFGLQNCEKIHFRHSSPPVTFCHGSPSRLTLGLVSQVGEAQRELGQGEKGRDSRSG